MQNTKAYIMLVCATLFWAGNFIVGKAASIIDIPPISLNFYRWFLAWLVLLPFTYKELLNNRKIIFDNVCLLYTSPSPRDNPASRMPSSA